MNGIEIKDFTDKLEGKFNRWYGHNIIDAEYDILLANFKLIEDESINQEELLCEKAKFIELNLERIMKEDKNFGRCLDEHFKTKAFSQLYNSNENPLKEFEKNLDNQGFIKYFDKDFDYRLLLPGKILEAKNAVVFGDTLSWKLNAYRMVFSNYEICAQTRKTNVWAFILSAFVVLLAVGSYFYKIK